MFNFAHFIPGTLDADYLRQQVSERGILEKIDALNELVKQCLGKDQSMTDFYRMIADIEDNLNRNMNDPRARNLINAFTKEPTPEDNTADSDNTTGPDNTTGTDNTTGSDNAASTKPATKRGTRKSKETE